MANLDANETDVPAQWLSACGFQGEVNAEARKWLSRAARLLLNNVPYGWKIAPVAAVMAIDEGGEPERFKVRIAGAFDGWWFFTDRIQQVLIQLGRLVTNGQFDCRKADAAIAEARWRGFLKTHHTLTQATPYGIAVARDTGDIPIPRQRFAPSLQSAMPTAASASPREEVDHPVDPAPSPPNQATSNPDSTPTPSSAAPCEEVDHPADPAPSPPNQATSNPDSTPTAASSKRRADRDSSSVRGKKAKRGRKPLSSVEERWRQDIFEEWEKARADGVTMKDFCRDHDPPLSRKELARIVSWRSMRIRRKSGI